jgi:DNA-binding NtrC family response regulator
MPAVMNELTNQAGEDSDPKVDPRHPRLPDPGFGCVYLAASAREAEAVSSMVESERIRIYHAVTLEDAVSRLKLTRSRVLLTNTRFRDGTWKDALETSQHIRPPAALVVASRLADEKLWLGVLERGAYDLIVKPFQAAELCRILRNAQAHAASGGLRRMTA